VDAMLSDGSQSAFVTIAKDLGHIDLLRLQNGKLLPLGELKLSDDLIVLGFRMTLEGHGNYLVKNNGDMVVSLFVVVDQKTSTTAYTNHYGMGGYGYGPRWGWYGGSGMGMGQSTTT
jgi:hypothetical protein